MFLVEFRQDEQFLARKTSGIALADFFQLFDCSIAGYTVIAACGKPGKKQQVIGRHGTALDPVCFDEAQRLNKIVVRVRRSQDLGFDASRPADGGVFVCRAGLRQINDFVEERECFLLLFRASSQQQRRERTECFKVIRISAEMILVVPVRFTVLADRLARLGQKNLRPFLGYFQFRFAHRLFGLVGTALKARGLG